MEREDQRKRSYTGGEHKHFSGKQNRQLGNPSSFFFFLVKLLVNTISIYTK